MARYRGPVCRLQRRLGADLSLKRFRPYGKKEREYPPGQHGNRKGRMRVSDYGVQLQEKQKAKFLYGLLENQFRSYYHKATRMHGATGENLLRLLESRLDNIVFRMGFAMTRAHARQLVHHNHFLVNGKKVNVPSYQVKVGDSVELREKSRQIPNIQLAWNMAGSGGAAEWVTRNVEGFSATLDRLPEVEEIKIPIKENLIVEFYSR
ncbi:MAG: 30S ribosomal protein S4 [Candidatus Omnitrophica bacterium]|nr:30S ribosomal protein S4 [Candidatus Omnitrophota bacterium]